MADDSPLQDPLAGNLQSAVDKKLTLHEGVLMTLAGAAGEGLVVTDRRVIIVREQMPIVAGETVVDCFAYPYEQIHTLRVEGAVGGGHLRLILTTPPVDDKEVTLYFPIYDLSKFDAAAARIRLLAEQTRSLPVAQAGAGAVSPRFCLACGAAAETKWSYCGQCGAGLGSICGSCRAAVPADARYCVDCGTKANGVRPLVCPGCSRPAAAWYTFCPACGEQLAARCPTCGGPTAAAWKHCAACGESLSDRGGK